MTPRIEEVRPTRAARYHVPYRRRRYRLLLSVGMLAAALALLATSGQSLGGTSAACGLALAAVFVAPLE